MSTVIEQALSLSKKSIFDYSENNIFDDLNNVYFGSLSPRDKTLVFGYTLHYKDIEYQCRLASSMIKKIIEPNLEKDVITLHLLAKPVSDFNTNIIRYVESLNLKKAKETFSAFFDYCEKAHVPYSVFLHIFISAFYYISINSYTESDLSKKQSFLLRSFEVSTNFPYKL